MTENINLLFVFAAGLTSVLSPCVLPVLPIVVAGGGNDNRFRPLLTVAGLSITFMLMGVISTLFGSIVGPKLYYAEKVAAVLIALAGILLFVNINPFKYLSFLSQFASRSKGAFGGLFLGITLGVIWIPCVGPMLSSVLALVATKGEIASGVGYLFVYSAGFAVPMLIAGYASHFFRKRLAVAGKHPRVVSAVSGAVLIVLGGIIFFKGMIGFGL